MTFRWANERGSGGMRPPNYWLRYGYVKVCRHPFWPASWLMEKR